MSWTWVLSILALTVPPSAAFVVSLLVQLRAARLQEMNKQHEQVLTNHEQTIELHNDQIAGLEALVQQQQTTINKLAEREF